MGPEDMLPSELSSNIVQIKRKEDSINNTCLNNMDKNKLKLSTTKRIVQTIPLQLSIVNLLRCVRLSSRLGSVLTLSCGPRFHLPAQSYWYLWLAADDSQA